MAGISSKALPFGEPENKKNKFQDQELNDDLGVNYYEFKYRNHDPQIGRFIQIDPLSEKYVYNSTYAFSENKVTTHVELEGLEAEWFERQVERDLRDLGSGKITREQLQQRVDERNAAGAFMATKVLPKVGIMALVVLQPEIGCPLAVADLTGVPVTPSPAAIETTVASELSTTMAAADELAPTVSLATKARVLEAGGEIGMMDGAATLAVDAKTGFFNVQVTAGAETGVITGEINITKGAIGFTNLEITNAKGGLGSISQQNTIGPEAFLKLQKEMTELTKAGGYNKATIEFSRLRPVGSKLPDTDTRTITLFDNTQH